MKQTAVEWLENEFKEAHKMFGGIDANWIKRFEQAKAMEKEQIIKAFNQSWHDRMNPYKTADKYYNETFDDKEYGINRNQSNQTESQEPKDN